MGFVIVILTALLVLNCLLLILLVLIQLPKKDAGAGMAFGGGAADALFGAGSGNALTKITKYATVIFFVLALFLGYLQDQAHNGNSSSAFEKQVQQKQMEAQLASNLETERKGERFVLIEPPLEPQKPVSPNQPLILALGAVLALGAAIGLMQLLETLDTRIRGREDIIALLTVPPLAVIPWVKPARN